MFSSSILLLLDNRFLYFRGCNRTGVPASQNTGLNALGLTRNPGLGHFLVGGGQRPSSTDLRQAATDAFQLHWLQVCPGPAEANIAA